MPAVRPALLDHLPATQPREGEARGGSHLVTTTFCSDWSIRSFRLQDDPDYTPDDEDDDEDDPHDDDDEDDDDDDEEVETWQVVSDLSPTPVRPQSDPR
jgi:hypothetical protein